MVLPIPTVGPLSIAIVLRTPVMRAWNIGDITAFAGQPAAVMLSTYSTPSTSRV
jgi:hypothetical protein